MSTFSVPITKILEITPIVGADQIELATVFGYQSVVRKGQFTQGDLVVYIPESSVVPDSLLEEMGLTGKLAGSKHNRVKAVRLRGTISQGLLYPTSSLTGSIQEGIDVTDQLGIVKYEPPIPTQMAGEVTNLGTEYTLKYDIENLQRYPLVLHKDEPVSFTEKLHGTFCCLAILPGVGINEKLLTIDPLVTLFAASKGLGSQGLVFQNNANNTRNVYQTALVANQQKLLAAYLDFHKPVYILGEVYGTGIQDLTYGAKTPEFRVFDIYVGMPNTGKYLNWNDVTELCSKVGLETVPVLYKGPYSDGVMRAFRDGKTTLNGENIREGIVIKPLVERRDQEIGRVILKSVSPDYLTRKGNATEYN